MVRLLIVLVMILILFIFLECFIKERFFSVGQRSYYYKVLKNILNIIVMVFILLCRKYIVSIVILGRFVIWCSEVMFIYNCYLLYKNIIILRKKNLL